MPDPKAADKTARTSDAAKAVDTPAGAAPPAQQTQDPTKPSAKAPPPESTQSQDRMAHDAAQQIALAPAVAHGTLPAADSPQVKDVQPVPNRPVAAQRTPLSDPADYEDDGIDRLDDSPESLAAQQGRPANAGVMQEIASLFRQIAGVATPGGNVKLDAPPHSNHLPPGGVFRTGNRLVNCDGQECDERGRLVRREDEEAAEAAEARRPPIR